MPSFAPAIGVWLLAGMASGVSFASPQVPGPSNQTDGTPPPVTGAAPAGQAPAGQEPAGQEPAEATDRLRRPYQGLFRDGAGAPTRRRALDFSGSVLAAYDDNAIPQGEHGVRDPRLQVGSPYAGLNAGLAYSRWGRRVTFRATGDSSLRYFTRYRELTGVAHTATVSLDATLTRRTTARAWHSITYSPFYLFGIFDRPVGDALGAAPNPSYAISPRKAITLSADVEASHTLSRASALGAAVSWRRTDVRETGDVWSNSQVFGLYRRRITRNTWVRAGYGYHEGRYSPSTGAGLRYGTHNLDVGVDYSRALSFSRRTRLTFGTGSSVFVTRESRHYNFLGHVTLEHEIGRSWIVAGEYRRGMQFLDGFVDPFFADTVTARIAGLISRRMDVQAMAGYASGNDALGHADRGFSSYTASGTATYALSRNLAVFGELFYHYYRFGSDVTLPAGFGPELDRRGVRGGLTVWLPLLR